LFSFFLSSLNFFLSSLNFFLLQLDCSDCGGHHHETNARNVKSAVYDVDFSSRGTVKDRLEKETRAIVSEWGFIYRSTRYPVIDDRSFEAEVAKIGHGAVPSLFAKITCKSLLPLFPSLSSSIFHLSFFTFHLSSFFLSFFLLLSFFLSSFFLILKRVNNNTTLLYLLSSFFFLSFIHSFKSSVNFQLVYLLGISMVV
jgi:hypothetical protein